MATTSGDIVGAERNVLPGFGAPLYQHSSLLTAMLWAPEPVTMRERLMVQLITDFKNKLEWERKVFEDDAVQEWREEAFGFRIGKPIHARGRRNSDYQDVTADLTLDGDARQLTLSDKIFEYMLRELQDDARAMLQSGFTPALNTNAIVYMSDTAISSAHQSSLKQSVAAVENVPACSKNWRADFEGTVLDLVHPSMFPITYGQTRILRTGKVALMNCSEYLGSGETLPQPVHETARMVENYSHKHQWLPCDVVMTNDGNAKIVSYINNLHPQDHKLLYSDIENVIARSIPLWVDCLLSTLYNPQCRMENPHDGLTDRFWDFDSDQDTDAASDPDNVDEEPFDPDHDDNFVYPEPRPYTKCRNRGKWFDPDSAREDDDSLDIRANILDQIKSSGLQVIVKMVNIHLTPENPSYSGGRWHIEGTLNEHICASALYYYDSDNVTDNYLGFREGVNKWVLQLEVAPSSHEGVRKVYSVPHAQAAPLQYLGRVQTRDGRLLVFPNVLQHRVSNFELADPTRPGHRKVLVLYFVDPFIRIPSSAHIPPQQAAWWTYNSNLRRILGDLPPEIAENIMKDVGFPVPKDVAWYARQNLTSERLMGSEAVIEDIKLDRYNL